MKKSPCGAKWPHFPKMHDFFSKKPNKRDEYHIKSKDIRFESVSDSSYEFQMEVDENSESIRDRVMIYADRWPNERTKLLIERRIFRDSMFDGRGFSSAAWQAVLLDLKSSGASNDLTMKQIRKKWENLCTRYKTLKESSSSETTWPFFQQLDEYFQTKATTFQNRKESEIDENLSSSEACTISDWETRQQNLLMEKLTKCRLCQEGKNDHLLQENKELCDRISDCTAIDVSENIDLMPSGICEQCKSTIDKFHQFLHKCRDVDKTLRSTIFPSTIIEIKTESSGAEVAPSFECTECPVAFNSSEILAEHVKSHKSSARFYCEMCSSSFSRQSALYSHIKRHFQMSTGAEEEPAHQIEFLVQKTDEDCDNNEPEAEQDNITETLYSCELCAKTYNNKRSLREHLQTHSRTILKCPRDDCDKTYSSLKSLRNHEMRHLGLHSFLCVICGKGFVTYNALKLHEKIHSEVKEHICEICSSAFSILSNLRSHQKKHHEGHRFYCSQCPKEFLTKSSLKRHELVHTGVKDFVCDTCSSAFFTIKELRKHKRYHEGVRLHHCNQCFKTFYEKHHLTVHIRSHTGERPFPCTVPECGKSFRESQKLSRHMKIHHRINSQ